jgi:IclR family acetate operon transcriptional repressor
MLFRKSLQAPGEVVKVSAMSNAHPEPDAAAPRASATPVTAVLRTTDVLSYLATSPTSPVGVTQIATALGLSKAVVFRILVSLLDRDYVEFDPQSRRYLLGPRSLSLGMAYLERADVRQPAHDALVKLSASSAETATLSLRTRWERMYVDQVLPADDI